MDSLGRGNEISVGVSVGRAAGPDRPTEEFGLD